MESQNGRIVQHTFFSLFVTVFWELAFGFVSLGFLFVFFFLLIECYCSVWFSAVFGLVFLLQELSKNFSKLSWCGTHMSVNFCHEDTGHPLSVWASLPVWTPPSFLVAAVSQLQQPITTMYFLKGREITCAEMFLSCPRDAASYNSPLI